MALGIPIKQKNKRDTPAFMQSSPKFISPRTLGILSGQSKDQKPLDLSFRAPNPNPQGVSPYVLSNFMNDFDEAMLRKGNQILNRDRSDSNNIFKTKSPGLIHDGFDDSPGVSPVLNSQNVPFSALSGLTNPGLHNMLPKTFYTHNGFVPMGYLPTSVIPRQMFGLAAQPFQGLKKDFKPRLSQASFGNPIGYSLPDANDNWLQSVFGASGMNNGYD